MSIDELIEAKLYRLEELRKYQSYYGPNTPYPVIVEICNHTEYHPTLTSVIDYTLHGVVK